MEEVERKYSHCSECFRIGSIPSSDIFILERIMFFGRTISAYSKGVLKLQKKYEKYLENIYKNEQIIWREGGIVNEYIEKAKEIKKIIKYFSQNSFFLNSLYFQSLFFYFFIIFGFY